MPMVSLVKEAIQPVRDTLTTPCPEVEPLVEGLVDRGDICVLAASPGLGKTPLVAQLGSSVAGGTPFLGLPTRQGRVALIDLESKPGGLRQLLTHQWAALGLDRNAVGTSLDLFVRGNPKDPNSRELDRVLTCSTDTRWNWLSELVVKRSYDLVIVDTALSFAPLKASDEEGVRSIFAVLARIRNQAPRPAILLTVHLRKHDRKSTPPSLAEDPHGWTEEILGSVVWSASADVCLGMQRYEDGESVVFSGYIRGRGALIPMVIQPHYEPFDGRPRPTHWRRCRGTELAAVLLTGGDQVHLCHLQEGEWLSWAEMQTRTGAAKSSLHRFIDRASKAAVLEVDYSAKPRRYRRTPLQKGAESV